MKSNCLIQGLKQFIKHPNSIKLIKRGKWSEIARLKWPHFYWLDKRDGNYYHYCAKYSDEPFINQIWLEGEIRSFHFHGK